MARISNGEVQYKVLQKDPTVIISIDGMPADCGFFSKHICKKYGFQPDFTISGINAGSNLGLDTQFSGTLAAAMSAD